MARYIDADVLTERIKYYHEHTIKNSAEHYAYGVALKEIDKTPTADVVEVRHGEWEAKEHTSISTNRHYYTFRCSECKRWNGTHRQRYCPNCGARMDGIPTTDGERK